jgi:hypothetical protein
MVSKIVAPKSRRLRMRRALVPFLAADFLAATGAAVGAVMVGTAAGPLEQPPSANNANISPTASAMLDP